MGQSSEAVAPLSRREFLRAAGAAAAGAAVSRAGAASDRPAGAGANDRFSFILLGDLHFDRAEHHDMNWVRREKPNDVAQIENYTRISREITPRLLASVRAAIAELAGGPATRVAFVLQVGDLVEGLCGSEELAVRQNREALEFVRAAELGAPLLFTKGNHDITGPGAAAAFQQVFHPFLAAQQASVLAGAPGGLDAPAVAPLAAARFTVEIGRAQFVFFDAYEATTSLEWLEAIAARRTAEHFFVIIHPPVVPYGARSLWHLFATEKEKARREKLLAVLGRQHAIVLGGHIHKFNALARAAGGGRFAQFALSSILAEESPAPKMELMGAADYTPDQVRVEPGFSPETEPARRAVYVTERPLVDAFQYADLPGYAVVTVDGPRVTARMFAGTSRRAWRNIDLGGLARG